MSQTEPSPKPALPGWLTPVAIFVGVGILLLLSNRPTYTEGGLVTVSSVGQYESYSNEALKLSKAPLAAAQENEPLTDKQKKDLQQSADYYEAMNQFNPIAIEPYFMCGKIYRILERNDVARERFEQAIANGETGIRQAKANGNQNREDAIRLTLAEARAEYSELLVQTGEFTEALNQADEAVKTVPNSADYLVARASASIQLKKLTQAKADLGIAIQLDPKNKKAIDLIALISAAGG